jgi:hypothetical protein
MAKNFDAKAQRGKGGSRKLKIPSLRLLFLCVLCVKNLSFFDLLNV